MGEKPLCFFAKLYEGNISIKCRVVPKYPYLGLKECLGEVVLLSAFLLQRATSKRHTAETNKKVQGTFLWPRWPQ